MSIERASNKKLPHSIATQATPHEPKSRDHRSDLGRLGELIALRYFEGESYQVESKNWRGRSGELDLILCHHQTLVIAEVRSTSSSWLERPAEATPVSKRRQVARCAHEYLKVRSKDAQQALHIRFDICGVFIPKSLWQQRFDIMSPLKLFEDQSCSQIPKGVEIDHVENAYFSPWAF